MTYFGHISKSFQLASSTTHDDILENDETNKDAKLRKIIFIPDRLNA
jgi:hypothetical protein